MVNGLYLFSAVLTSSHSKRFTIRHNIHPFMHTFTHRRRCHPRRAIASSSGAVRARRLAQGHLETQLGGDGDRTSNLPVTSQPTLPPEQHFALKLTVVWPFLSCLCSSRRLTNAIHYETSGCQLQHVVKHTPSYLCCGRRPFFLLWWRTQQSTLPSSLLTGYALLQERRDTEWYYITWRAYNITCCMLYDLALKNSTWHCVVSYPSYLCRIQGMS